MPKANIQCSKILYLLLLMSLKTSAISPLETAVFIAGPGKVAKDAEDGSLPVYDLSTGPLSCTVMMPSIDKNLSGTATMLSKGEIYPSTVLFDLKYGPQSLDFTGKGEVGLYFVNDNGKGPNFHSNALLVRCIHETQSQYLKTKRLRAVSGAFVDRGR